MRQVSSDVMIINLTAKQLDALIRISETSQNFIGEVAGWFKECEEARKMHEGQRALTEWLKSLRKL